ncbi:hypothetical protein ACFLYQ_01820 [Chloroflexota bacterium]
MKRIIFVALIGLITLSGCSADVPSESPETVSAGADTVIPEVEESIHEDPVYREDSSGDCEEVDVVMLTAAPADPADLSHIFPMGLMSGAHVTPVDHQYYYWADLDVPLERYPVYSPADGYIINVQYLNDDYIVFIEHSCDVQTEFIHLEKLVGPLADIDGTVSWHSGWRGHVPVKAGEMIALDGGTNGFDFSVHDYSMTLPGFIKPESYVAEPWKTHTADPYDFFTEPVRSKLLEKNARQVEPLGGKIDYDIFGRLIGNWFEEGTNGYAGVAQPSGLIAPDQQVGYWNTHLAVAPDPIDPSAIIVSMGWFEGRTAQYAVNNLYVRPEDVLVETGIVKYELVDWGYVYGEDDEPWGGITRQVENGIRLKTYTNTHGVALFQLLDEGHLKMEVFSDMTPDEVSDFTGNAKIYVR